MLPLILEMPNPVIPPPARPSGRPVTKMTFIPVVPRGVTKGPSRVLGPPPGPLEPPLANAKGTAVIGIVIGSISVLMGPFMAPLLLLADVVEDEALM